jgi:RNA ligase (TIGR02306 family)
MVKGNFPTFIPKTDQARCQNIAAEIFVNNADSEYEESMKMDGSSFSAYHYNELNGVCSRNWDLTVDSTNDSNSLVRMYIDSGLRDALAKIGANYAVQGELMGPGIQNNRESFTSNKLFIFDIYDIDSANYLPPHDRHAVLEKLYLNGLNPEMVKHVPVFSHSTTLAALGISNIKELLARAEGPSLVHPVSEGKVYKRKDGKFSFKAISNAYLLKEKD